MTYLVTLTSSLAALCALLAAPAARAERNLWPKGRFEAMEQAREAAERQSGREAKDSEREEREEREGAGPAALDPDDPAARYRAQHEMMEGSVSDAALLQQLRAARRERDRVGQTQLQMQQQIQAQRLQSAGQAGVSPLTTSGPIVQSGSWINIGPDNADIAQDGPGDVDSGRMRSIVPHPNDPNILYVATAGGGVWKTWDNGATWSPLSDRLGALGSGSLAMDPSNPDILALGFGDPFDSTLQASGITVTTDGGITWSNPQPQTVSINGVPTVARQVRDLKFDPLDSSHLFAATDAGLFTSTDFGATWQPAAWPGGSDWTAWSIGYVGTGACATGRCSQWLVAGQHVDSAYGEIGLDLFRSNDGGVTWTRALLPSGEKDNAGRATIAVAPSTSGGDSAVTRVYVLAAYSVQWGMATRDVYRSDDGGLTFHGLGVNSQRSPTNPNNDLSTLDVLSFQSWYNQSIIVDPVDPNVVLIGGMLSMIRTTDAGKTWSVISDWLPIAEQINQPYVHADHHAMAARVSPPATAGGTPQVRFFFGSDGGLFYSDDIHTAAPGKATVVSGLNKGIVSFLAYTVVCPRAQWPDSMQDFVMGGFQDNGTRMRTTTSSSDTGTFNVIFGGDGFGAGVTRSVVAGPTPYPTLMIATTFGGANFSPIHVSRDGGNNWSEMSGGLVTTNLPFIMVIQPEDTPDGDGETFLTYSNPAGGQPGHVYRLTNASSIPPWKLIDGTISYPDTTTDTTFKDAFNQLVAPHNLGTHQKKAGVDAMTGSAGSVFTTSDAGGHWIASRPLGTSPTEQRQIKGATGIDFDWSDPSNKTIWVGSNSNSLYDSSGNQITGAAGVVPDSYGHLFKSTDAGLTWQPVHGSGVHTMPNVPVNTVKFDPNDALTVYVGTGFGLYVTHDGGQTFDRMGTGLPLADVKDICLNPVTGTVRVATYGRGFWEIDKHAPGVSAGARGNGDLDFNQRLDAFDLVQMVNAMGTTNADDGYRQQADMTGRSATIDDADLSLFLSRFGGTP
jgi:photosystem II stability/assembly factor-like uncharacterized protein